MAAVATALWAVMDGRRSRAQQRDPQAAATMKQGLLNNL